MGRWTPRPRRFVAGGRVAAGILLGILVVLPVSSIAAARSTPAAAAQCSGLQSSYGISANVTWNGIDVCSGSSASSALSVDFSQSASVVFHWTAAAGTRLDLDDARLTMDYFGFALDTRDVVQSGSVPQSNGSFPMDWNPGVLTYVLEGVYGVTASLFASNGTSVWSESFFVKATAPYAILAALPLLLIFLGVYEVYELARSGRHAAPRARPPASPPASSGTAEPTPSTAEAPEGTAEEDGSVGSAGSSPGDDGGPS